MNAQNYFKMNWQNMALKAMGRHFSDIAKKYRDLRTTDSEPITLIVDKMKNLSHVEAVDVGCGDGRYDLLLYKQLGDKLRLTCLDANSDMLKSLNGHLTKHGIVNFTSMRSEAERMPFSDNALDCVCTFNAIHHFSLPDFLKESARILGNRGYLFIYTRLHEQNGRNIWGMYFPRFNEKETRLYTLDALKQAIETAGNLAIESIVFFAYNRMAALEQLLERARSHHYSTFFLYSPEELSEALKGFSTNILNEFKDPHQVRWFDENILFIVRKVE
jgi:ubiquinone/menaquinone biosynthesis C-methylase UbiE